MATLESEADPWTGARDQAAGIGWLSLAWRGKRLAAVVTVIALFLAATASFLVIHSKFGPHTVHAPRHQVKSPGVAVCLTNCTLGTSVFTTEKIGWVSEWRQTSERQPVATELFVTTDGGHRWRQALSLGNHRVQQILASADGSKVLIVGSPYDAAPALFRSTDGGQTWRTLPYPAAAGNGSYPLAANVCARVAPHTFFLNPDEGWIIAQTATGWANVHHTVDGGSQWAATGSFDIKSQFGVDVVSGMPCKGTVTHELPGQFQFENSATGWYLPFDQHGSPANARLYRTQDGGLNWKAISIAMPADNSFKDAAQVTSLTFFSPEAGAAVVGEAAGSAIRYVFQTTDGGAHWGNPVRTPMQARIQLIDATHWVGWPYDGGWMRTSDAGQHWEIVRRTAAPTDDEVTPDGVLPSADFGWSFQFLNPSFGLAYVTGSHGSGISLYMTSDGGTNWTPLSLPELS